jgi:hypothetical protein
MVSGHSWLSLYVAQIERIIPIPADIPGYHINGIKLAFEEKHESAI